jgi:hypothetical protein
MDTNKFSLSERYRLELHWEKLFYDSPGICKLVNAYFVGPALSDAEKINDNDFIMLDFFKQYVVIVSNVYVAKLSWATVVYKNDGKVYLNGTILSHDTELNKVPKLNNNDYLIIDTAGHETAQHAFNLVYKTYVVNEATQLYNFRSK